MMGVSLGLSHGVNLFLGDLFTRLIALAGLMGMLGAMFIPQLSPLLWDQTLTYGQHELLS